MQKTKHTGRSLLAIAGLLLAIILLENIRSWIPGLPAVFAPTSQLFTPC